MATKRSEDAVKTNRGSWLSRMLAGTVTPDYESDLTTFMREFLKRNPELPEKQLRNRATWWDKKLDLEEMRRQEAAEVERKPYAYYDSPVPDKKSS
jgi:Protein of unknown function (DUF3460)